MNKSKLPEDIRNKPAEVFLHFLKAYPEDFHVTKTTPNPVYSQMVLSHKRNIRVTIRVGNDDHFVIVGDDSTNSRQITTGSSSTAVGLWNAGLEVIRSKEEMKEHYLNEEASKILMDTYGETF